MQNNFKHITSIQIRFKDIDKLGHVNNANHLSYIELARLQYFADVIGTEIDWERQGLILARIEIDYKKPILLEDKIVVQTRCSHIGSKSFDLSWTIVKENDMNEVLALGKVVLVCFDYASQQPIPVPADWKQKMEQYEGSVN